MDNAGFTLDDRHLKGNIFAGISAPLNTSVLNANNNEVKKLPRNSQSLPPGRIPVASFAPGYEQSKAEVQQQVAAMWERLHPQEPSNAWRDRYP